MLRRTTLIGRSLAVLLFVVGLILGGWFLFVPPSDDSLVRLTEAQVQSRIGRPYRNSDGHYGNPDLPWADQFSGAIKSSVFRRFGGEVYVSYEKRNGVWVVIRNSWLPDGAAF
jgi:hypothetical protein